MQSYECVQKAVFVRILSVSLFSFVSSYFDFCDAAITSQANDSLKNHLKATAIIANTSEDSGILKNKPQKRHDPRFIRDMLFKSEQLTQMHEENQALHTRLLRNINLRKADSRTIPPIALSSCAVGSSASKANREMFLKSIIAAVKCVNQMIMEHRNLVKLVKERDLSNLNEEQVEQFRMICSFYQTSNINELLKRVAPVPVSLAAAQASLECGFGSVKFMSTRNAYFGMMKNQTELQSFDTVFQAAIAYAKTLNVHGYYRAFREERLKMLNKSQKIDGMKLCAFIAKYCVRKEYRQRVTKLIRDYKLTEFDQTFEAA